VKNVHMDISALKLVTAKNATAVMTTIARISPANVRCV